MKFQDDISMPPPPPPTKKNTYEQAETNMSPTFSKLGHKELLKLIINQRTNGPVNAHLISGSNLSTKQKQGQEMTLTLNTHFHLLN